MTDQQKLLLPYVESRVESIVSEKSENYGGFILATDLEILSPIHTDVIECMRELYQSGKYKGTRTLNNPALMKKQNDINKK